MTRDDPRPSERQWRFLEIVREVCPEAIQGLRDEILPALKRLSYGIDLMATWEAFTDAQLERKPEKRAAADLVVNWAVKWNLTHVHDHNRRPPRWVLEGVARTLTHWNEYPDSAESMSWARTPRFALPKPFAVEGHRELASIPNDWWTPRPSCESSEEYTERVDRALERIRAAAYERAAEVWTPKPKPRRFRSSSVPLDDTGLYELASYQVEQLSCTKIAAKYKRDGFHGLNASVIREDIERAAKELGLSLREPLRGPHPKL